MSLHLISLSIGLITIVGTLVSLRREHIRTEYSVSWLAVGIVLTGLSAFPSLLDMASSHLGVGPEGCFLIIGGTLISALVFEMTRVVSRLRDENVILAQRLAILEFQMQDSGERHGQQDA
jgi:hypothetical protein